MIRLEEFRRFVMPRFAAGAPADVPIWWPNSVFRQPENGPFIRFLDVGGEGAPMTIGRTWSRYHGIIQADLMTPLDVDIVDTNARAEMIAGIFSEQSFPVTATGHVVRFKTASVTHLGETDGQYRTMIRTLYCRDVQAS